MEKEYIRECEHSVTLNVTAGKIDSFRELEKTTGTVRVYENGCVGVAGCLGEPDERELTERAKEALAFGIPYPCDLEGPLVREALREKEIFPIRDFLPKMQAFLDRLGALCPKFALSGKFYLESARSDYKNSGGRRLASSDSAFAVSLLAQERGSGNLFDTAFQWAGNHFDPDVLLAQFQKEYEAFHRPATLPAGRWPVVVADDELFGTMLRHFVGDLYAAGASLLSGKLGQKVFSDKLSFRVDKNPATAIGKHFFDAEGVVAPDDRPTLVEQGVLKGLLTTKKTAAQYGLPVLGTASAAYDGVPGPGFGDGRFWLDPTAGSLKELIPGKAMYVVVAAGGDMTPDGHFATPVQMAYLMEDGELVGRLPELNVSGDFFDLFGKDYLGTVRDEPLENYLLSAFRMDVDAG